MQFIGSVGVLFLLLQCRTITSAPTDITSPGEQDNTESQLVDTIMTQGSQHTFKDKKNVDYYEYRHVVADGIQKALDECRTKFKWERWNCPKKAFLSILDREEFSMGQSPLPSNKELGLTRALIASGIALSMIKSCSVGASSMCGCGNPVTIPVQNVDPTTVVPIPPPDVRILPDSVTVKPQDINQADPLKDVKFGWNGCDEIVRFGFKVARIYLDSQDIQQGESSRLINVHNYEVGRQAVKRLMKRKCKCHGPSGTCQVNTCWTVIPDISEVGDHLKREYRVAAKVGAMTAKETDATSLEKELSFIGPEKLVFADASPDYCYENKQLGINGTLGRYCSRSKRKSDGSPVSRSERDSCDRLCTKCGYKIKRELVNVEKQCDCRFVYCCSVECKRCPHVDDTFKCVRHS